MNVSPASRVNVYPLSYWIVVGNAGFYVRRFRLLRFSMFRWSPRSSTRAGWGRLALRSMLDARLGSSRKLNSAWSYPKLRRQWLGCVEVSWRLPFFLGLRYLCFHCNSLLPQYSCWIYLGPCLRWTDCNRLNGQRCSGPHSCRCHHFAFPRRQTPCIWGNPKYSQSHQPLQI